MRILKSDEFPKRLLEIPDPPQELYMDGELPKENMRWLAIVGSRKYTDYGKDAIERIIEGLRGSSIVIVSGLAFGIDSIAHKAALKNGLACVAVPGSGLNRNVLYPSQNRYLAEEIIQKGGALVTEFEPNFRATAWSFPQRNRIMAGLSDAVLVVEAEEKSGTLITSRLASDYNRDVFTIPGSIFSSTSAGPHMLLKLGATPITSSEDLLTALGFESAAGLEKSRDYSSCSPEEMRVISLLSAPLERDVLLAKIGPPIGKANAILSMLELKGIIDESCGEIRLAR